MTPWTRVNNELALIGKDWKWLAAKLGIEKMQTVDHWEKRKIPEKYHAVIESSLKKYRGWIDGDEPVFIAPEGLSIEAIRLARLLDVIPESDLINRSTAITRATDAVLQSLQSGGYINQADLELGKRSE